MPLIDIFAPAGLFVDMRKLATEAARLGMSIEQVPGLPLFRKNNACFVHELPTDAISDAGGDANDVRKMRIDAKRARKR